MIKRTEDVSFDYKGTANEREINEIYAAAIAVLSSLGVDMTPEEYFSSVN